MKNQVLKKVFVSIIAVGIVLIGMIALWPDSPTSAFVGNLAQYDLFIDHHHEPPQPHLAINYTRGQQGSYFRITATDYPAFNTAVVTINDELIGTVSLDSNGSAVFQLKTTDADNGVYFVTTTAAVDAPTDASQTNTEPTAETVFTIHPDAPSRPFTGKTVILTVPAGIASYYYTYIPALYKEND